VRLVSLPREQLEKKRNHGFAKRARRTPRPR
jgi:hypothetical protein